LAFYTFNSHLFFHNKKKIFFLTGSSVCNGDSGGGMVFPRQLNDGTEVWMLRGIVSHSKLRGGHYNICDTKSYIIFTDVAEYLSWIYEMII
jgi:secreted trypsin-like serine protease